MAKRIIISIILISAALFGDVAVSTANQDQTDVSAAGMASRSFVAWTDTRAGTGNTNIYGNIIDTDGSLVSTDITICVAGGLQYDVAASAGQKFMAFWVDGRTTDEWDIWGRAVNIDGTPSDTNFQVTTNTTQKGKTAAADLDNDILVVFEESGTNSTIRGQKLSWSGSNYAPSGSVFDISDGTSNAYAPDVAAGDADYLVAWTDTDNQGVYARRVSSAGAPIGSAELLADYSSTAYSPGHAAVAWDGSQWLVVWDIYITGYSMNICGRFVSSSGTPTGSEINITTSTENESYPDVAFDGIGFLVVYQDTRDIYANIYGNRIVGTSVGADEAISTGSYNQNKPSVAWNGTYHDVFWQDYRGTYNWDVYTVREDQTPWDGPSASPLTPPDMGASSCIRQDAVMNLTDPDGINTSSIRFTANGTSYDISDAELSYAAGRLTFSPSSDWPENVWIECCLDSAADMTGLAILNPVCWSFMIDRTNPVFGTANPADGDSAGAGAVPISIDVTDAGCGVSTTNMGFQIEGTWYVYGVSSAVSWDGTAMRFDPSAEGIAFEPFDTIDVCARVRDRADYCVANEVSTCWSFYTTGTKIYGTVTLVGEIDHSGATVEARYGDSLWSDITDASGSYSIPGVMEVAGIVVTAYKTGFSDSTITVDMSSGGFGEANFTLYPRVNLYFSDFETDDGGLDTMVFTYYNDWEWGVPTSGPGSAHSGTKCWATQLNTDYHDSSQSRLVLGPVDLPESSAPTLSWWQWYRFQQPTSGPSWHDGGNVKLWLSTTDSTILTPEPAYDHAMSRWNWFIKYENAYADDDNGNFWHRATVDLSTWAGQTVYISWDFGSSSRNTESGWFIDDVAVGYTDYTAISSGSNLPDVQTIDVYPNPFNATCAIEATGAVEIFDISGRMVRHLESNSDGKLARMLWDGRDAAGKKLPSGIYFVRLAGESDGAKRIVLLR